ncbi:MAG TPA: rod shape-determining protein [Candidatus Ozemobacteraceae bacterium]|nr:rod shape-determining protein [Candidatus Ozemobacteraceae bacterium]
MTTNGQVTVVIGNGVAGAAAAIAMRDSGYAGKIVAVTGEAWPVYYRTRLPELISEQTGINCFVAEEPMESVARGTGKALAEIDKLNRLGRSGILATSRKGRKWKS